MRQVMLALLAAGVVATACSSDDAGQTSSIITTTTTVPRLVASFDWSMPDRFGLDGNADGRIDLPNSAAYAHNVEPGSCPSGCPSGPPRFGVVLSAESSTSDIGPIDSYVWTITSGSQLAAEVESAVPEVNVLLAEGEYDVVLVVGVGSATATTRRTVEVEDYLIVSIGDSFASGEGNPEATGVEAGPLGERAVGIWADDGEAEGGPVAAGHRRAHRSTLGGPAQAALAVETADSASSVTFLFLASSGASIDTGILEPHGGVPYEDAGDGMLMPQIDALATMLGCTSSGPPECNRTVDALTISIGGNDMGFGLVWGGLIAADPELSIGPSYRLTVNAIMIAGEQGIADLESGFATLNKAIRDRVAVETVFITAYPSIVGVGDAACEAAATDLVPGLEVDRAEIDEALERVLDPLNEAVAAAARRHGWVFVDDHLEVFGTHGVCGTEPYSPDLSGQSLPRAGRRAG